MISFEKPDYRIAEYQESNHYGKFELEPLERGFGTTIGNALRRVMLSSLPGSAIVSVKIEGVLHEFQKIDGVVEDVTSIVLALKNVVVKKHTEELKTLRLFKDTEGPVTAGDFEKNSDVEVINPELVICNLVEGGKIDMEVTISNDLRRATHDLDLDFIKYSLDDKSIKHFISKINNKDDITNWKIDYTPKNF